MWYIQRAFTLYLLVSLCDVVKCSTDKPTPCASRSESDYWMLKNILTLENKLKEIEEKRSVYFMAELSANLENPPVGMTVVFDKVHSRGSHAYNANTGIFSAPYSGLYTFSLVTSSPSRDKYKGLHLYMMKNAEQIGYIFHDGISDNWVQSSTSAVVYLEAGDQAFAKIVSVTGNPTLAGCCFHTVFSGYLIR